MALRYIVNSRAACLAQPYINALETAYGGALSSNVSSILCNTFAMIYGGGTPNESDLSSKLIDDLNSRLFLYTPQNDSTASFSAYRISVNLELGTFFNMVSGDLSVNGVTGGTNKYLNFNVAPTDIGDNHTLICYSRTNSAAGQVDIGSTLLSGSTLIQTSLLNTRNASNVTVSYISHGVPSGQVANTDSSGLFIVSRNNSSDYQVYRNSSLLANHSLATISANNQSIFGHAYNRAGSVATESSRQLCTLGFCEGLTANEAEDLAYLINYYNTNIITGGRNTY